MSPTIYDLVIIGGGINGCGIAADAAGRGLKVLLAEKDDLAGATSSASSKLIHGGLRYLEHYEFRLVREALAEREVLLRKAPHIVWPLRFVLPHVPGLRPPWMIRAGLFLYDHLYRRRAIPASRSIDLRSDAAGNPLRADLGSGFTYWDCWVDDARLVVLNARAAADKGAEIRTHCRVVSARADNGQWRVTLRSGDAQHDVTARALVNAAGPWVGAVQTTLQQGPRRNHGGVRLVKGSHVVLPRIPGAEDAYLLQSPDRRVVFALPFEQDFTIIGTTDVPYAGDPAAVRIDDTETEYLLSLAQKFFKVPLRRQDIVWTYAGVRPLYDDQTTDPSAVTRDYHLELAAGADVPPLLTIMGGKVTTYRRLALETLERLAPHLPAMGPSWTESAPLPGGDMPGADFDVWLADLQRRLPGFDPAFLRRLARRHGTATVDIIGEARDLSGMGRHFGAGLTEREVLHLRDREWARTAEDVLWRRTKIGLHLTPAERDAAVREIEQLL
ncbi:MAG: glycerol-3-phosphate dehydrogenase [Hyphomicrobiaceae bacterium]